MSTKQDISLELRSISEAVANLSQTQPFEVPTGYFENLPEQMMNRIRESDQRGKVVQFSKNRTVFRYAVAASLVGLLLAAAVFLFRSANDDQPLMASLTPSSSKTGISEEAMQSYLNEVEAISVTTLHQDDVYGENLLVQMDRETVTLMLAEVSETGMDAFIKDKNNEIIFNN